MCLARRLFLPPPSSFLRLSEKGASQSGLLLLFSFLDSSTCNRQSESSRAGGTGIPGRASPLASTRVCAADTVHSRCPRRLARAAVVAQLSELCPENCFLVPGQAPGLRDRQPYRQGSLEPPGAGRSRPGGVLPPASRKVTASGAPWPCAARKGSCVSCPRVRPEVYRLGVDTACRRSQSLGSPAGLGGFPGLCGPHRGGGQGHLPQGLGTFKVRTTLETSRTVPGTRHAFKCFTDCCHRPLDSSRKHPDAT